MRQTFKHSDKKGKKAHAYFAVLQKQFHHVTAVTLESDGNELMLLMRETALEAAAWEVGVLPDFKCRAGKESNCSWNYETKLTKTNSSEKSYSESWSEDIFICIKSHPYLFSYIK